MKLGPTGLPETDWQDIVGEPLTEAFKIPSGRRLFLNMGELERSLKSKDRSVSHDHPELLSLPTPREPLREWTEIKPGVIVAAVEAVMRIARSLPHFESRRLARKTATKFRY